MLRATLVAINAKSAVPCWVPLTYHQGCCCSRTFISCMCSTAAKNIELDFYTRLSKEFHSDLWWWHTFLTSWNSLGILWCMSLPSNPHHHIQTGVQEKPIAGRDCVGNQNFQNFPNKTQN